MTWPWGTYLGEEALAERHPHEDLELAAHAAERHPARLEGDRRLPQLDARGAPRRRTPATTRRSCSRPRAPSPTGPGETIFVVKTGTIYTPDLSTGILHGITRDSIIQIAARPRLHGAREDADPLRPLPRRRGVHVRHRRRGDAGAVGRRPRDRRRRRSRASSRRRTSTRCAASSDRWSQWRELVPEHDAARRVSTATRRINLSAPWIDERDEELVLEVLRSGQLSLGPTGPRFEALLADAVGAPYCAAVSSGTAGLHLCMRLAGVGPGDEVITSPYSFVASANCAIYEGATPVFADIDPRTLNLDPAAVEAAITPRTKAIVAVDIFGYPCELDELRAICDRHGLALVEDACEALGARYKGRPLGSHGHPGDVGLLPEQADDDRRGRRGHDRLGRGARAARLAPQPGPARDVELAPARPARLQLPARRHLGRARHRPAREARPDPRRRGARSRRATASCSRASTSSCRSPTTPTTCARGSSTS